jgi:hypothetical protein
VAKNKEEHQEAFWGRGSLAGKRKMENGKTNRLKYNHLINMLNEDLWRKKKNEGKNQHREKNNHKGREGRTFLLPQLTSRGDGEVSQRRPE